jgi:hypothetical protein
MITYHQTFLRGSNHNARAAEKEAVCHQHFVWIFNDKAGEVKVAPNHSVARSIY